MMQLSLLQRSNFMLRATQKRWLNEQKLHNISRTIVIITACTTCSVRSERLSSLRKITIKITIFNDFDFSAIFFSFYAFSNFSFLQSTRSVDPYGTGGTCPPNILEVMSFRMSTRVTATVVYSTLMQILCVVSQKSFSFWGLRPPDSHRGSASGPRWGTSVPQTPSLLLCPPNNLVRSTPLAITEH